MKIGIASDHRGYKAKSKLIPYLQKKGYEVKDYGTDSLQSVDYPDFAFALGKGIQAEEIEKGILICGTGIGIGIAANKVKGVRCAKVDSVGDAKHCRIDNNANVIAFGEKIGIWKAKDMIDVFLQTSFSTNERHHKRVDKMDGYQE